MPFVGGTIVKGCQGVTSVSARSRAARRLRGDCDVIRKGANHHRQTLQAFGFGWFCSADVVSWTKPKTQKPQRSTGTTQATEYTILTPYDTYFFYMLRSFTIDDSNFAAIAERTASNRGWPAQRRPADYISARRPPRAGRP